MTIFDGSSPLLRGTSFVTQFLPYRFRFIPAPAGNIPYRSCEWRREAVHPRSCGEHNFWGCRYITVAGSSPLLRGTFAKYHSRYHGERFIPAPAGNIRLKNNRFGILSVHPRSCGEHLSGKALQPANDGSSPLLRGTLCRLSRNDCPDRFIPAPAGNIVAVLKPPPF